MWPNFIKFKFYLNLTKRNFAVWRRYERQIMANTRVKFGFKFSVFKKL